MKSELTVYSDGGARGNPGPAGCGYVIYDEYEDLIEIDAFFIKRATNNQAEYRALLKAVQAVNKLAPQEVVFYLDSELIVKQLNGEYKVKNAGLKELYGEVVSELDVLESYEIKHVRREKNKIADKLVNIAMDVGLAK